MNYDALGRYTASKEKALELSRQGFNPANGLRFVKDTHVAMPQLQRTVNAVFCNSMKD